MRPLLIAITCALLSACETRPEPGAIPPESAADLSRAPRPSSVVAPAAEPPIEGRAFAQISGPGERGEPLEVSGRVYEPDGLTPAPGVVVYVYHTDAEGLYAPEPDLPPRLRAWMVTDDQGRFRYRTIKPGSYPRSTIAAHVHTQLWSERFAPQYNLDLNFRDDPYLGASEIEHSDGLGVFAHIAVPERGADGVLRATHNLRLKAGGDVFEDVILHGVRDAPTEVKPRQAPPSRRS